VGYWASKFVENDGSKVVGIIEYNSAIYSKKGFNVDDVKKYFNEKGTL
jgi:glutamate dehydrogenase/leucine dehydrogenase